jgi:hypothetical protein
MNEEEKKICVSIVNSIEEPGQMCIKQNDTHFEQLFDKKTDYRHAHRISEQNYKPRMTRREDKTDKKRDFVASTGRGILLDLVRRWKLSLGEGGGASTW